MAVTRNDETDRFELVSEGTTAFLEFRARDGDLVLTHTEVPESLEGRGVGSELVRAALADARERDLTVVPVCPFVASYLERHPEEAATVRVAPPTS
jgi:hypothetical protein